MIFFWVKEAFRIFGRAKSSFVLSLITLSISILLIAVSFYSIFLSHQIEKKIKEQFILNIFISDTLSTNSINNLKSDLENKNYTSAISYTDKEKAAEIFIKDTGEDFRKILDYNPIPASLSLKLKSEFVNKDSIEIIKKQISLLPGIDEIMFEHEMLEKLVNALKSLQRYIFMITVVLILISMYITYSTIKLVISLKHEELETMKLVGARLSTIKMPIILNELITGFLAGILSFGVIKFSFFMLTKYSPTLNAYHPPIEYLLLILLIGPTISLFVSVFVLRKITLRI
jgi:cell division transport system permease protein